MQEMINLKKLLNNMVTTDYVEGIEKLVNAMARAWIASVTLLIIMTSVEKTDYFLNDPCNTAQALYTVDKCFVKSSISNGFLA